MYVITPLVVAEVLLRCENLKLAKPIHLLIACGNVNDEVSISDNEVVTNSSSQDEKEETNQDDSTEIDSTHSKTEEENKKTESSNSEPIEEEAVTTASDLSGNMQEQYLLKYEATKDEMDRIEPPDSSTYAIKKVEDDRYDAWDELLNEAYGVITEQLPKDEMDQLRSEQQEWIQYRDDTALEASLKYKGGTQEHVEYMTALANLTEERSYELITDYMK